VKEKRKRKVGRGVLFLSPPLFNVFKNLGGEKKKK
jgi:hypothetical protein